MSDDLYTRAYQDFQAGRISLQDFYAIVDVVRERDNAEDARRAERERQKKPKHFVSVNINIPLN